MCVSVVVVVMVVVMSTVGMVLMTGHFVVRVCGYFFNQARDVLLQLTEVTVRLARLLIHVKTPIHFNLNRVFALLWIGIGAHQLDTFVGVVDPNVVAHLFQHNRNEGREIGRASCSISITQHKVCPSNARPLFRND